MRETKLERQARLAKEKAERELKEEISYQDRLMNILERAAKYSYSLAILNGELVLTDRETQYFYTFSLNYTESSNDKLYDLLRDIEYRDEERRKEEAHELAKRKALSKLTDEELELLNINRYS